MKRSLKLRNNLCPSLNACKTCRGPFYFSKAESTCMGDNIFCSVRKEKNCIKSRCSREQISNPPVRHWLINVRNMSITLYDCLHNFLLKSSGFVWHLHQSLRQKPAWETILCGVCTLGNVNCAWTWFELKTNHVTSFFVGTRYIHVRCCLYDLCSYSTFKYFKI